MNKLLKIILWLTVFSIAMGFMESAIVIYLRELYYPGGFNFPLLPMPAHIALVEFLREAATIIMLIGVGAIAGKNLAERFSFFLFCFAVWDLFYYIFLKLFIDWPGSLFTWDILFLIPVPWVGPVLAPCITSLTMIVLTLSVVYFHRKDVMVTINMREWLLLITGSVVLIVSFIMDYVRFVSATRNSFWTPSSRQQLFSELSSYVPQSYNWFVFTAGELLIITAIFIMVRRHLIPRA